MPDDKLVDELSELAEQPAGNDIVYIVDVSEPVDEDKDKYMEIDNLLAGTVSDHGELDGLTDDDHSQYLLRQPDDNVVINESGGDYDFRIESNGNDRIFLVDAGADEVRLGGASNYAKVGVGGVVSLVGTAKRTLSIRPDINVDEIKKQTVPDQVQVGVFFGYSMPVWNSDHEELYMRHVVPGRWDGASNITAHVLVALADAEDVDDYFKFQLSWNNVADASDVVPATTHNVTAEQIVLTDRSAQYNVYELMFTIDYDADGAGNEIQAHDILSYRLRRVDATNPDVTNEIIVFCWHTHYQVDKMFNAP